VLVGVGSPNDAKYGPFADVATANSEIGSTLRYKGLTVGILVGGAVVEYWYEAGITDSDLVVKSGGGGTWGSITGTLSDQTDLQTALDGKVDENAAITGSTKTKITYDAKGLVTAGADATTADIADSTNKRYVTDAQLTVIGNTSGTNTGDNAVNSLYSGLATSKQDTLVSGTNIKTVEGQSLLGSGNIDITKSDVGLGNVDNTSDANKPISTATQTALDGKVDENAAITGATKTKITYDSKGLVTAGADLAASDLPTGIDATKLADGSVTNTELQYINSVTSNVQTQLDAKIATYDGATYDVTALAAVTQAEYDALTPSATTLYFII
jgi:hypothetical protein